MHILVLPASYPTVDNPVRGIFFYQQAQALKKAGYQVGVVAPVYRSLRLLRTKLRGWSYGLTYELDKGVPTYLYHNWAWLGSLGYGYLWMKSGEMLFKRYITDYGLPDLIHAHTARFAGILANHLWKQYQVPYIITEHSSGYARNIIFARQIPLVKEAFLNAKKRLVVSPTLGGLLEDVLGSVVSPWEWVPNMVDSRFTINNKAKQDKAKHFCFLNVALMTENKGQQNLLEAFARQFKGNKQVHLRLGGNGPLYNKLKQLTAELEIDQQVTFLGLLSRDEVVAEMQAADVFVLSSYYETFGVVLIEALACGKPVIATACGGPESIVYKENGILVPPGDIVALSDALKQMLVNYTMYDAVSIRANCLSRFSEKAIVTQLDSIYKTLASIGNSS